LRSLYFGSEFLPFFIEETSELSNCWPSII